MKRIIPDLRVQTQRGLDIYALRQLAKNEPDAFIMKAQRLIDEGKITLTGMRNLQAIYHALRDVKIKVVMDDMAGMAQRAVEASAFPILTGNIVIKMINDRYQQVPTIGDQLVTDFEDNKKVTTIAAIHNMDKDVDEVKETEDFPEISAGEEKAEIRHKRNGRLLKITQEMIDENEIADIVNRINGLADISVDWVEEQTLRRIMDYDGSCASPGEPYVWRPDGSGAALYSATANTPGSRAPLGTRIENNALVDETDLDATRTRLSSMRNSRGKRIDIPINQCVILTPDALTGTLSKILNSTYVPGVENEVSNWGPSGKWRPRPLSSARVDDFSTTAWYMGMFKEQFRRKWKLRFEYVTLGANTESYLRARIAFQARIAWDVEIGAVDYVYVVQCLSGTTAPKDA
jgi:hypothetical protein